MSWLQKISQIPAASLPFQLWYHGTDSITAYRLMENMLVKPRSDTGESSYMGSLSSIPTNVYLTLNPGKAAKHAIERAEQQKTQPVILVIRPESLGMVHIDEDMVHMLLNGHSFFETSDWYPSPLLEREIFDLAADYFGISDFDTEQSIKKQVLEHLRYQQEYGSGEDIDDEFLQEEGIIPDSGGLFEYDPSMHAAKDIARTLNTIHQKEAITNFQSLAHEGQVQASEIYIIPWNIERQLDDGVTWEDSPTSMRSYEDLHQFGTKINPQQLLMPFMYEKNAISNNWLTKIAVWIYTSTDGTKTPCRRSPSCDATDRSRNWLMRFPDGDFSIPRSRLSWEDTSVPRGQLLLF